MKFKITDENGRDFSVEKTEEKAPELRRFKDEPEKKEVAPQCDAEKKELTDDELKLLRKLLKKADALLELVEDDEDADKDDKEEEAEDDKDAAAATEEFDSDEELLEISEDEEGIQDSESCEDEDGVCAHDSKKSYGAIERKSTVDDSIDIDTEIAQAWAKRYGGNK